MSFFRTMVVFRRQRKQHRRFVFFFSGFLARFRRVFPPCRFSASGIGRLCLPCMRHLREATEVRRNFWSTSSFSCVRRLPLFHNDRFLMLPKADLSCRHFLVWRADSQWLVGFVSSWSVQHVAVAVVDAMSTTTTAVIYSLFGFSLEAV